MHQTVLTRAARKPSSTSKSAGFTIRGASNLLDSFHKGIRPLVQSGLIHIGCTFRPEPLHLLLVRHVEARYAEDRLHRVAVEFREALDHDVLRPLKDLLISQKRVAKLAIAGVCKHGL